MLAISHASAQYTLSLKNDQVVEGDVYRFFDKSIYLKSDTSSSKFRVKEITAVRSSHGVLKGPPINADLVLYSGNSLRGHILTFSEDSLELHSQFPRKSFHYSEIQRIIKLKNGRRTDLLASVGYSLGAWFVVSVMMSTHPDRTLGTQLKRSAFITLPVFAFAVGISVESHRVDGKKKRFLKVTNVLQKK